MRESKQKLTSGIEQAFYILVIGVLLGIAYNHFGPHGLSWSRSGQGLPVIRDSMEITLEEARSLYDKGAAVFVDARDPGSFRAGHIMGALNINSESLSSNLPFIKSLSGSGKIIITYCDGLECPLGRDLARSLRQQGLADVRVLAGGLSFWAQARHPVDGESR